MLLHQYRISLPSHLDQHTWPYVEVLFCVGYCHAFACVVAKVSDGNAHSVLLEVTNASTTTKMRYMRMIWPTLEADVGAIAVASVISIGKLCRVYSHLWLPRHLNAECLLARGMKENVAKPTSVTGSLSLYHPFYSPHETRT